MFAQFSDIELISISTFSILCVIGLIVNTLVIIAFSRFKLYRLPSNLQLFSLAMDDLGTALLAEPLAILMYLKPQMFSEEESLCRYFLTLLHIFPWGSTMSILILSVTRILIVVYPLAYRSYFTCKHIYIALTGKYVFLFCFVIFSNPFWFTVFDDQRKACFASYGRPSNDNLSGGFNYRSHNLKQNRTLPALLITGGCVIFCLNMIVVIKLVHIKMKKIVKGRTSHVWNAGIELLLLVSVYMFTTISIPAVFITDLAHIKLSPQQMALSSFIAKFLFYLQPILNPLVYVIRRPEYRSNMKRAMTSLRRNDRQLPYEARARFYNTAKVVINRNKFIKQVEIVKKVVEAERRVSPKALSHSIGEHFVRSKSVTESMDCSKVKRFLSTPNLNRSTPETLALQILNSEYIACPETTHILAAELIQGSDSKRDVNELNTLIAGEAGQ